MNCRKYRIATLHTTGFLPLLLFFTCPLPRWLPLRLALATRFTQSVLRKAYRSTKSWCNPAASFSRSTNNFIRIFLLRQSLHLFLQPVLRNITCGSSSAGRAQPCQGWGRGFESRLPLQKISSLCGGFFLKTNEKWKSFLLWFACSFALVVELVDTQDLKSCSQQCEYRFKSDPGHRFSVSYKGSQAWTFLFTTICKQAAGAAMFPILI